MTAFLLAEETPMPKAYWISAYRAIHDHEAL
ncbi:MAG: hypothetical protein RI988_1252, partial [Pseudomonadota bacterium]